MKKIGHRFTKKRTTAILLSIMLVLSFMSSLMTSVPNASAAVNQDIQDIINDAKLRVGVIFESNGGTEVSIPDIRSVDACKTGCAIDAPTPTKEGFVFEGWYFDVALTDKFLGKIYGHTILKAKWIPVGTVARVTSTIGVVSTLGGPNETITNIPNGTLVIDLIVEVTPVDGATFDVYEEDGTTPLINLDTTLTTGNKLIVISEDGSTKVTYTLTVNAGISKIATITSTIGTVSAGGSANESITNIPSGTTVTALKAAITPAAGATFDVYDADGTTLAATLATGKKVIVTAQDKITKVTYNLIVDPAIGTSVLSKDGTLTLPLGKSGEVSLDNAITISVPVDAASKELKLTIERLLDNKQLLTDKNVLISPIFEILKNLSENFDKPVTLTFAFDPTKLSGDQQPAVFYYDESKKLWVEVGGIVTGGNLITVNVNHFTKFAVMAVGQAAIVLEKPEDPKDSMITFSDIRGHWSEDNIKKAVSSGIVAGYPDGTFKPDKTVTRAEFAVMLINALKPQSKEAELTFADKEKIANWAQSAVAKAVDAGIIGGYEDGTFRPAAEITRAEMAVMIARALKLALPANSVTDFSDDSTIPAWSKGAIGELKKLGIVGGKGANEFVPNAQTTRAEAVTVLLNMLAQKNK